MDTKVLQERRRILKEKHERETKAYEKAIEEIENQINSIRDVSYKNFIDEIFNNIFDIKSIIEEWDLLKFNGYKIDRESLMVNFFAIDKNLNKYNIYLEHGEFTLLIEPCLNNTQEANPDEITEDLDLIIAKLNEMFQNY